ncbi:spore coat protein F [Xylanibacillus composti]|uniref:Spore coat protein F n=2 Tax=Xylanibacillus composti TaxID=1572762 RepID=A0A8J4M3S7_9BACL|nr:spore coat protein F [Xylanibacillus composti]
MYATNRQSHQQHLAWHETLEMHELVAYQANHLVNFKMNRNDVKDPQLKGLYAEAIQGIESNLQDLLGYYPQAPTAMRKSAGDEMTAFYAGQLLGFAKTAVRNYAIAITETATPQLRETFHKHLDKAIQLHGKVFAFMYERGLYPSYQLDQLLAADVKNAKNALSL